MALSLKMQSSPKIYDDFHADDEDEEELARICFL
jgi:hypothetical protein